MDTKLIDCNISFIMILVYQAYLHHKQNKTPNVDCLKANREITRQDTIKSVASVDHIVNTVIVL